MAAFIPRIDLFCVLSSHYLLSLLSLLFAYAASCDVFFCIFPDIFNLVLHAALLTAASFAHGHLLALYRLLAFAIPSRHGLRGVASHHFALALPRLSRHGLHGVASHHFALALAVP